MLGELAQLMGVRAVVPRRREGDERDALRGRLLGGICAGDDEGQAEQRHGCVRLACWRGRCFALPCAVKAPRRFVVAALGKVLAARGPDSASIRLASLDKAWTAEMLVCVVTLGRCILVCKNELATAL